MEGPSFLRVGPLPGAPPPNSGLPLGLQDADGRRCGGSAAVLGGHGGHPGMHRNSVQQKWGGGLTFPPPSRWVCPAQPLAGSQHVAFPPASRPPINLRPSPSIEVIVQASMGRGEGKPRYQAPRGSPRSEQEWGPTYYGYQLHRVRSSNATSMGR